MEGRERWASGARTRLLVLGWERERGAGPGMNGFGWPPLRPRETRAEGAGLPLSRTRPSWNSLVPRRPQTLPRPLSPLFCYPNLLRIPRWLQVPPPATCAAAPLRADSPVWPRPLHALQKTCLLGYLLYGGSEGTEDLHRLRTALQCISIEGGSEGHGTSFCESQTGRLRRRNALHDGLPSPHPWQLHPG